MTVTGIEKILRTCFLIFSFMSLLSACGGGESAPSGAESDVVVRVIADEEEPGRGVIAGIPGPVATMTAGPVSGQASLSVSFVAANEGNANVIGYEWDFGDGNTATGASVSHNYDTPGTYTATVTLTDSNGQTDTASRQIYVFGSTVDNSQVVVPANVLFFDAFDYTVNRSGDTLDAFQAAGWNGGKAENFGNRGKGYIYTTSHIPGYNGSFPGKNSTRVLAIEGRPSTFNQQTDFYLHYGTGDPEAIPGNVWFQFWIYINDYDDPTNQNDQMSHFANNGKFIYPTKDSYPTHSGTWLMGTSVNSKEPFNDMLPSRPSSPYLHLADLENISYQRTNGSTNWKIGQTNIDERIIANRWTLVKIHIDTSTSSGVFEQWIKPMGGSWTKVVEWIDGVTPNFSWRIPANEIGGHRAFRMPTTHNPCSDPSLSCDFWIYMDDFSMANSEEALPVYPY